MNHGGMVAPLNKKVQGSTPGSGMAFLCGVSWGCPLDTPVSPTNINNIGVATDKEIPSGDIKG